MNAAREAIQAYWIAGGPLLALLALIAFGIWAYYFRTRFCLKTLHHLATRAPQSEENAEHWQTLARRDLGILAAFTAAAPLVGLLGTVLGMVETFDAVSEVAGEPGRRMAGGIRQALVTTQFGLLIAIPGVFGIAQLQRHAREVDVALITARHEARPS